MIKEAALRDADNGRWLSFAEPTRVVVARRLEEVVGALEEVDLAVEKDHLTAVGFLAYEAAPAFDPAFRTRRPEGDLPLVCFGLFESGLRTSGPQSSRSRSSTVGEWTATESEAAHGRAVERIRDHIARGDTYQVNHTFRLRAPFDGDPKGLFRDLVRRQPRSYAAYLDLGGRVVCSASPELFFRLEGDRLLSKPMKGTARRGWSLESDRERERRLAESEKDRAENAMIVDMVRNDVGRIARNGTVEVTRRFEVERHPTVFQMTSTVEARTDASVAEIMAAAFPFASVTGAPKIRTTELITQLESEPRGIYTGAIGIIRPGRRARFAVGIRTAVVDRASKTVEYGVGSGIVWDSKAGDEYRECAAKARILSHPVPEFDLLETMLWRPGEGFVLLERHLDRLAGAAEYFGRPFSRDDVLKRLSANPAAPEPLRVRILIDAEGTVRLEAVPIEATADTAPVRLGLAVDPVKREDPFLHFKTTHRGVYDRARASRPDCDDVLLWNEQGEVTESTIANLVLRIDGGLVTPPVASGLLAGTFRAELLHRGEISERVITVGDLPRAESIRLVNSVQGWRDVEWSPQSGIGGLDNGDPGGES